MRLYNESPVCGGRNVFSMVLAVQNQMQLLSNRIGGLAALSLIVALAGILAPRLLHAEPLALPMSNDAVINVVTEHGLLFEGEFEALDDPYVGPLIVGRAQDREAPASAVSVILYQGESGPNQVRIVLTAPWNDLPERIEMAADIVDLAIEVPPVYGAPPNDPTLAGMSQTARWLYGLMTESWFGWPGSDQRLVRVRDGVAVIVEGIPPEIWGITLVMDEGQPDQTWPGAFHELHSPGVTAGRALIRAGEYQLAYDVLLPLAEVEDPQAATLMGDMYRYGRLDYSSMERAADWYLIGGRFRYPPAVWALASMSNEGWGVFFVSNFKAPLIVQAAETGSADALYLLSGTNAGVNYVRPEGVTAFDQILTSAQWGLLGAQQDIALRYATANEVEGDAVEAYAWALVALANTGPGLDDIRSHQLVADLRKGLSDAEIAAAELRAGELVTGPPAWPEEVDDNIVTD
jgi:hypothetical protein